MSNAVKVKFAKKQAPLGRAWGYLINIAKHQLEHMLAQDMHLAQPLRAFLTKAEKFQYRPNAVPGITVDSEKRSALLWVSEAPGGVLASIVLPLTPMLLSHHRLLSHAMILHRDEEKETSYDDSWEW